MFKSKFFKFFYGIVLLPFCYSLFLVLFFVLKNIETTNKVFLFFLGGCFFYLVLHLFFYKPIKMYVFGHELVHALSAWLCGGKVGKMKLKNSSGEVSVSKVNTFIALSPYFVPIYSLFLVVLWSIFKYLLKFSIKEEIFIFLLGVTVMFHIVLTLYAVSVGQQDFNISGWFFSIVVICIINVVVLVILIMLFLPVKLEVKDVVEKVLVSTHESYKNVIVLFNKIISGMKDKYNG